MPVIKYFQNKDCSFLSSGVNPNFSSPDARFKMWQIFVVHSFVACGKIACRGAWALLGLGNGVTGARREC